MVVGENQRYLANFNDYNLEKKSAQQNVSWAKYLEAANLD